MLTLKALKGLLETEIENRMQGSGIPANQAAAPQGHTERISKPELHEQASFDRAPRVGWSLLTLLGRAGKGSPAQHCSCSPPSSSLAATSSVLSPSASHSSQPTSRSPASVQPSPSTRARPGHSRSAICPFPSQDGPLSRSCGPGALPALEARGLGLACGRKEVRPGGGGRAAERRAARSFSPRATEGLRGWLFWFFSPGGLTGVSKTAKDWILMEKTMQRSPAQFRAQAKVMKALAHPTRMFIVDELSRGERCVCELTEMIGAEMPTVSRHLSLLKGVGRWMTRSGGRRSSIGCGCRAA